MSVVMWEALLGRQTSVVVPPQRPDLILPANVPDIEARVLVCDCLDIEADSGDGGDNIAVIQLESV